MRGSREISLVPSLHRASTDALIMDSESMDKVCVLGVGKKRKKESPSKSLGGVCRPHRMWLPSGLKYM